MPLPRFPCPPAVRRRLQGFQSLPVVRLGRDYLCRPFLFILLAVAADKLIFYAGFPAAGYLRHEWYFHRASEAFQAGHEEQALVAIHQALLETRGDAACWRLAARISRKIDSPEEAYCWQQADRLTPGQLEIQFALIEAALRHGQADLAAAGMHNILPANRASLRYALDAGELAQVQGDADAAGIWFAQAESFQPHDPSALLTLARWHASLPGNDNITRADALLLQLDAFPAEHLVARRERVALDLRRHLPTVREDEIALLAAPGATMDDRIIQLDLASDRTSFETTLKALLRNASTEDAAHIFTWMARHEGAEAALILIRRGDEEWQDDPAIGAARARCLAALGDWPHLRDDQRDSVWPGHEAERLAWLAKAHLILGDSNNARDTWQRALAACTGPGDFTILDGMAGSDPPEYAARERAEIWATLANRYPGQQWPLRALLAYQLRRGDLVAAQALAQRLGSLAPDDPALAANADLIALRRGDLTAQVEADLQRLTRIAPNDPAVATATAYAFYLQGRFDEALASLGALDPATLRTPDRTALLGRLLAVAGPPDRAESILMKTLAQPVDLLPATRREMQDALDLVAARRALIGWRHGSDAATRAAARTFFDIHAATEKPVFLIGEAVVRANQPSKAALALARVDSDDLDPARLMLYEGAVLDLAGLPTEAAPLLDLTPSPPPRTAAERWHRSVGAWWLLANRDATEPAFLAGLLTAYAGLDAVEQSPGFWQSDAARELRLTHRALEYTELAAPAQRRLEALLHHVSPTPEIEAEIAYALLLQGRVEAALERLQTLTPQERAQPEIACYDAAILRACRALKRNGAFFIASRDASGQTSP